MRIDLKWRTRRVDTEIEARAHLKSGTPPSCGEWEEDDSLRSMLQQKQLVDWVQNQCQCRNYQRQRVGVAIAGAGASAGSGWNWNYE